MRNTQEHEALARSLNDPARHLDYARPYDKYHCHPIARVLGDIFVAIGDFVYGRGPSYEKFKAVEIAARAPYASWELAAYTLLTFLYTNERRAMELGNTAAYSRVAQDNETMHVVVLSSMVARRGSGRVFRHTLLPFLAALKYFAIGYLLSFVWPRLAFELNYLFESHAYSQYDAFLDLHRDELKARPVASEYLRFYGRDVANEYEFFELVRNDELIHRNRSAQEARAHASRH